MLQNAYLLAKIGADTAENEQHFAEILPIGRRVHADPSSGPASRGRGPPGFWIDRGAAPEPQGSATTAEPQGWGTYVKTKFKIKSNLIENWIENWIEN